MTETTEEKYKRLSKQKEHTYHESLWWLTYVYNKNRPNLEEHLRIIQPTSAEE